MADEKLTTLVNKLEAIGAFQSHLIQDHLYQTVQRSSKSTAENLNAFHSTSGNLNENAESTTDNDNFTRGITLENTGNAAINVNTTTDLRKQEGNATLGVQDTVGVSTTVADPNANVVSVDDVNTLLSQVKENLSDASRNVLLDQVTQAIETAHLTTTINTHINVEKANERFQRSANEGPERFSVNANDLWQRFTSAMLPEITKVIEFCTKLPGFLQVRQEDKMSLIKQGCFEVMVTRFCLLVDHVNEELLDPTLELKASRQVVQDTLMGNFLDTFFALASQFNPLGLTDEEIGLFTAVLLLRPDREGLINQDTIKLIHLLYVQSLYLLLKKNHTDADQTFCKLFKIVPIISKMNKEHMRYLQLIKTKSPTEFEKKFPPLHHEIFAVSS